MFVADRIKQVLEFRGWTQSELADRLGVTQSSIAYLGSGRLTPSDGLIDSLAVQTGFPTSFFHEPAEEEFPIGSLLFRARSSMTSTERTAYRHAQLGFHIAYRLLKRMRSVPVRIPTLADLPDVAAMVTRSTLGLGPDKPVGRLIYTIERAGVVVIALPVTLEKIDAFSTWAGSKQERPVIVMSRIPYNEDGARLRFSIAHELGHLVMHRPMSGDVATMEHEADQFAAEFLLPSEAIRAELVPPVTLSSLAALKPRWKVSLQALCMRATEAGCITERQRKYLFQQLSVRGWRKREPVNLDVQVENPQTLNQLATAAFGNPVNYRALAAHVRLGEDVVRRFIEATLDDSSGGTIIAFDTFAQGAN